MSSASLDSTSHFATTVLPAVRDYDALRRDFRWHVPQAFNIGVAVCDVWAARDPRRTAIVHHRADGRCEDISYGWLRETSNRLANTLKAAGISRGDRVALLLPQAPEVAAIHIAVYKVAAVALPLAVLFGVDAISYRLKDAGAKAVITNAAGLEKLAAVRADLPDLKLVLSLDGAGEGAADFYAATARASDQFDPVATLADDAAMMIYTSGTTGPPKGALEPHRVLLGHLPGVEFVHEFFPQAGDRMWTPADWAWAGGLLNILLPGLYYGVPVVARKFEKFDADEAYRADGADRRAQRLHPADRAAHAARRAIAKRTACVFLRTVGSGGEALGAETFEWGSRARHHNQRILRPDRMQQDRRRRAAPSAYRRPARSASRCPAIASR